MSPYKILKRVLVLSLLTVSTFALAGITQAQDKPIERVDNDKIRFSFADQPWVPIIEHFAEEAGFSLQKIDEPPPGTFNYHDDQEYTVMEALDTINTALVRQGYTLIRYKRLLILRPLGDIPDQLIEEITPDELDERGKFEVLRCVFDATGLEDIDIERDVTALISEDYSSSFSYARASKKIFVKETGDRLRAIRDLLADARKMSVSANLQMRTYRMKHTDAESLLIIVRQFMGMGPDQNQLPDGSLSIAVQLPIGDKLYLSGTKEKIERFLQIAETVDSPEDTDTEYQIEKPEIKTYQVLSMPEVVFRVLQTLLEGRDGVRMEQNPDTGNIVVQGRQEDHEIVVATIAELSKSSPGFAFINIENADAAEVVAKLQAMFGQSTLDEGTQSGPTLLADTIANQLMVRGTPQEVELVKQMVLQLDVKSTFSSGPRTNERFIEMNEMEKDDVIGWVPDIWGSVGRQNRLNIIMPEERLSDPRTIPELPMIDRPLRRPENPPVDEKTDDNTDTTRLPAIPKASAPKDRNSFALSLSARLIEGNWANAAYRGPDEDDQETSQETEAKRQRNDGYQPPQEVPSVPGSPVEVRWTRNGVVIKSQDLDALDDLEDLIYKRLNQAGTIQRPTLIPLNHCNVAEAKTKLEAILGISDGGGGGGGGLGSMMGGVMSNAIGGAAGDVLGGLFGGGGGGSDLSSELEGEVRFSMDVRLNTLIVTGATDNDLGFIRELVNFIDRSDAPQLIDTLGDTYVIPVVHRDPVELKEKIEEQLPDLFKSAAGNGGGQNPQAAAQQQMMRAIQQMTGRGGNRGGSSDPEAEKPKATLGVDEKSRSILVTGQEFIYRKVLDVVTKLDREELTAGQSVGMYSVKGEMDAGNLGEILKNIYGDKVELVITGEEGSGNSGSRNNAGGSGNSVSPASALGRQNQAIQQAFQQQMMRAMQQRAQSRGQTGRGGGGNTRGGGGRGGR